MTELRQPDPVPAKDEAGHGGPSEDATADIEEQQDSERAKQREEGCPPADAPVD